MEICSKTQETQNVTTSRGGKGWEVGGRFRKEGPYVSLWLIHADVRQKSNQYCKAIINQLKISKYNKKEKKEKKTRDLVSFLLAPLINQSLFPAALPPAHPPILSAHAAG